MTSRDLTSKIKALAIEEDFARVGIASAGPVGRRELLDEWLGRRWHAEMAYMARNPAKRKQPDLLVPGARSVICLAVGYAHDNCRVDGEVRIARYACGRDYHKVLKRCCGRLMDRIRQVAPHFQGRAFVDSAPVAERPLAAAAGIGWIGRNGCLVASELGSYVLLCEIICNLPLRPDEPIASCCNDCEACVRACPTGALSGEGLVDCRKCISYLTVEHRGEIDDKYRLPIGTRLFGCDACQEACPHNRSLPAGEAELAPAQRPLGGAGLADILAWRREDWDRATRGRATRRAKYERFLRNAIIAAGNTSRGELLQPLRDLARRGGPAGLIDWASGRLRGGD